MSNNPRLNVAFGGVLGATAVVASLLALSGGVSAQDSTPDAEDDAVAAESTGVEALAEDGDLTFDDAALDEAWASYDKCLADNRIETSLDAEEFELDEAALGNGSVFVDEGDEFSIADFGTGDGVITIIKEGDELTVEGSGDVEINEVTLDDEADWEIEGDWDLEADAEWGKAFQACEGELPDDVEFGEFMIEADSGDWGESEAVEVPAES